MSASIVALLVVLALVAVLAVVRWYGVWRWASVTRALWSRLEAARRPIRPARVDFRDLPGLPGPVERYFRAVLREGQPMLAAVGIEHSGHFSVGEAKAHWRPFRSRERVITQCPGFAWDGRIWLLPGLAVCVHDAYLGGEGLLHAAALGLLTLMRMPSTPQLAEGELMRFLAKSAWYPTVLLPGQGVHWEAVDDHSAKATLVDETTRVSLLFRFDEAGLIGSVSADARGFVTQGRVVPRSWECRLWDYQVRGGMLLPMAGEVAWRLPEGRRPYWRGRITRIEHEPAAAAITLERASVRT